MKTSKITLNLLFCILFTNLILAQSTSDYISFTTPYNYDGNIYHVGDDNKISKAAVNDLAHDKTLLKSFSNIVSNVTVYQMTKEGKLDVLGVGVSVKDKYYQVIYDFSQTQTLDTDFKEYESILVGVGVRMVAKIKTLKAGINLSSPFSLVADIDKVEGALEVRVSGIGSQKINDLIPTTSDLSPASISNALQAVASIKSHMYDKETIINPQILAYSLKGKKINQGVTKLTINK
ncbi:hypothetical protein BTO06_09885 [Tenacibaculum sp. SZ-18]|uniref:hypothetical protein n=1 Tax=Tenacibaculum sp. SZ-18 TaxID=754423 RepID=UPI000C2CFF98|nr:hypothetical protein [Tenacibaculum sp. SZ-18]AUC15430.1 hypothetical protein BTO06_09885 [Tenacibaculum sp. SZ-18]